CACEFGEAHFITLGLVYEKQARFAGGAFAPLLRRVDRFLKQPLKSAYAVREERAARVETADAALKSIVDRLKRRGIRHPFVKNFVLARCNPLTRARKSVPGFDQALDRLIQALRDFDVPTTPPSPHASGGPRRSCRHRGSPRLRPCPGSRPCRPPTS